MRAPNIFRTLAFRIVFVYVAIFAVSVAALIGFTYWNTDRALVAETDQTIEAEIAGLAEQYQRLGLSGLTDVIIGRSIRGGQGLYLLTDKLHRIIAGNLDRWPVTKAHPGNFIEFDYQRRIGGQLDTRRARGRAFALVGGFQLLVARDVHELYQSEQLFTTALPWTAGLMLMLAIIGGGLMSRNLLARLESINRTSREIMAGDLSRRVPVTSAHDEFDTLAENLNRMLERIERLMRGMREVTDSIAHDLRSPLNRLRNRLEGVLSHMDSESDQGHEIESAVSETDRLIGTFNALLLIAETEAGVVRETMSFVDLTSVLEGVAELYAPVAEEKGLSLEIAPHGSVGTEGNRTLISQALANLVDNAIKYTQAGGRIVVSLDEVPEGVALQVSDNGPGIAEENRARVLERFVRLEESRNSPGLGLGLSLVAAVARLHDARFELLDNRPGLRARLVFGRASRRSVPRLAAPIHA